MILMLKNTNLKDINTLFPTKDKGALLPYFVFTYKLFYFLSIKGEKHARIFKELKIV